jgi:hypothetical protein
MPAKKASTRKTAKAPAKKAAKKPAKKAIKKPAKKAAAKKAAKKPAKKAAAKKSAKKAAAPKKAAKKTAVKKAAKKSSQAKPKAPRKARAASKGRCSAQPAAAAATLAVKEAAAAVPSGSVFMKSEAAAPVRTPLGDPHADPRSLPEQYGHTRLTVLVRDPEWLFAYWEITEEDARSHGLSGASQAGPKIALRVYDVTGVRFTGGNARSFFDVPVTEYAKSWYLHVGVPCRSWSVDLGTIGADGTFTVIARSNRVETPRAAVSDETDEQWMEVDEERFESIFRLSGGETVLAAGASEGIGQRITQRILPQYLAGASEQFASEAALRRAAGEEEKGFRLQVDYELIVYGATEPDAELTICGEPVRLRPDGTFTVQFALPDGDRRIEVEATNAAGDENRAAGTKITKKSY